MNWVGTKIYGYCNGFFGRDDYETKLIIFEGHKWIVCTYIEDGIYFKAGEVNHVNFDSVEEKNKYLADWSVDHE